MSKVIAEVEKVEGVGVCKYKVGDRIIYEGTNTQEVRCLPTFVGMAPILYALKNEAKLSYTDPDGKTRLCCGSMVHEPGEKKGNRVYFAIWRED